MVKFIGIFVMSTQLLVAIDGVSSERAFSNSRAGVEQLIEYVDRHIEPAPDGIFFLIGSLDDFGPQDPIIEKLHELDLKCSLVLPEEIEQANPEPARASGKAVIEGFKLRRARLFGRRP
jgi:hypothetical protein